MEEKIPFTQAEYDGWREGPVGRWFFDVYLRGYADEAAKANGRSVGFTEETKDKEFMTYVWNAGQIHGVEFAVEADPFEEYREYEEDQSSRPTGPS